MAAGLGDWMIGAGRNALASTWQICVGSVSNVAVTLIRGAATVILLATGFSTEDCRVPSAADWITRASVVPTSLLGQDSSLPGGPRSPRAGQSERSPAGGGSGR